MDEPTIPSTPDAPEAVDQDSGSEPDDREDPTPSARFEVLQVDPRATSFYTTHGRNESMEPLSCAHDLESVCILVNYIPRIEGLDNCLGLVELELYQNLIGKIENIDHLTKLKILDLAFNCIRKVEGISALVNLSRLHLTSNKIAKIEGLATLLDLEYLELGANRIRVIEGLDTLVKLKELWLGKNKIRNMEMPQLPNLVRLSLQANRLTGWNSTLFDLTTLEELYLSENGLTDIPDEISKLSRLKILDLASNKIDKIPPGLEKLKELEDLWINSNRIPDLDAIDTLREMPSLRTVYLEHNPLQSNLGGGYKGSLIRLMPFITQLDADTLPNAQCGKLSEADEITKF